MHSNILHCSIYSFTGFSLKLLCSKKVMAGCFIQIGEENKIQEQSLYFLSIVMILTVLKQFSKSHMCD